MTSPNDTDVKVDIALIQNPVDKVYDFEIGDDGDFVATYGFDTSLTQDVLAEKRANEGEVPIAERRRGWIGNETPAEVGYEIGSKLWFYEQAKNTLTKKNGCADTVRDSLNWYVPSLLREVRLTSKLTAEGVVLEITLVRKSGKIDKLYFRLWELTGI